MGKENPPKRLRNRNCEVIAKQIPSVLQLKHALFFPKICSSPLLDFVAQYLRIKWSKRAFVHGDLPHVSVIAYLWFVCDLLKKFFI